MQAMVAVDRANYAPQDSCGGMAYQDRPKPIGFNATISAPHMHAHSLCMLADHLQPGARALDVGSGSGYLCACMSRMVGPQGKVIGIDYLQPLVQIAHENISKEDASLWEGGRLLVEQ